MISTSMREIYEAYVDATQSELAFDPFDEDYSSYKYRIVYDHTWSKHFSTSKCRDYDSYRSLIVWNREKRLIRKLYSLGNAA